MSEIMSFGKFQLFHHDYDGEWVQIVFDGEQFAVKEKELEALLQEFVSKRRAINIGGNRQIGILK